MEVLRLNQEKIVFDPKALNCKIYEVEYRKELFVLFEPYRNITLRIIWDMGYNYFAYCLEYGL